MTNTAQEHGTLAERIAYARGLADMSTAQIARRAGVQSKTLAHWEAGKSEPRANRLVQLAGVLNVSPAWLISGHGEAPEESAAKADIAHIRDELRHLADLNSALGEAIVRMENIISNIK